MKTTPKMKVTLTREYRLNGTLHKPEQTLELNEASAKFLLKNKAAVPFKPDAGGK